MNRYHDPQSKGGPAPRMRRINPAGRGMGNEGRPRTDGRLPHPGGNSARPTSFDPRPLGGPGGRPMPANYQNKGGFGPTKGGGFFSPMQPPPMTTMPVPDYSMKPMHPLQQQGGRPLPGSMGGVGGMFGGGGGFAPGFFESPERLALMQLLGLI